ncbi:hypothetical protein KKHFBJBL_00079 [Brevundimonas sp. NIBR11]|nr:hypothetical protein KKHFBJBL_00079 [Brevundimonas sp. NIBR11]
MLAPVASERLAQAPAVFDDIHLGRDGADVFAAMARGT